MSTKQQHITGCDGPGCPSSQSEGTRIIAPNWYFLDGDGDRLDFCSVGCTATWAMAKASDLTGKEPDGD